MIASGVKTHSRSFHERESDDSGDDDRRLDRRDGVCRDDARSGAMLCLDHSRSCRATRRTAGWRSTRWRPTWPAGLTEGVKDVVSEAAAYVDARLLFYPSEPVRVEKTAVASQNNLK
jgi:hypothetical protein